MLFCDIIWKKFLANVGWENIGELNNMNSECCSTVNEPEKSNRRSVLKEIALTVIFLGIFAAFLGLDTFISNVAHNNKQGGQSITEIHDFYVCFGKIYPFTAKQRETLRPLVIELLQEAKTRLDTKENSLAREKEEMISRIPTTSVSQSANDLANFFSTVDLLNDNVKILDQKIKQVKKDRQYLGGTAAAAGFFREAVMIGLISSKPNYGLDGGGGLD